MATAARAEINRTEINRSNAAHSTGPRTEEGKDRSKLNALSHGLASNQVVLPHENLDDYNTLKASFKENHLPGSGLETEFLDRMVDSFWRLQRAHRVESHFLNQREKAIAGENEGLEGDAALALLFADPKEMARLRLFMRYLGSAERAWTRAVADFEKAKKARLRNERELDILAMLEEQEQKAAHAAALPSAAAEPAAAGFVREPEWSDPCCPNMQDEIARQRILIARDRAAWAAEAAQCTVAA